VLEANDALGEENGRRALEEICKKRRSGHALQTEVGPKRLKHQRRKQTDEKDRQQINANTRTAVLRPGDGPIRMG
jgi:hypothetical protein